MTNDGGAVKYLERPGFFVCCFDACILMWTSALHLKSQTLLNALYIA